MIIRDVQRTATGYKVIVETPAAYADGFARVDDVHLPREALQGKSREERIEAIRAAIADKHRDLRDVDLDLPITETKAIWESRMLARYERWQRWKVTREEAESRTLSAAIITALTTAEDAAWAAYAQAINAWRQAP